jgi:hypothetical protein
MTERHAAELTRDPAETTADDLARLRMWRPGPHMWRAGIALLAQPLRYRVPRPWQPVIDAALGGAYGMAFTAADRLGG